MKIRNCHEWPVWQKNIGYNKAQKQASTRFLKFIARRERQKREIEWEINSEYKNISTQKLVNIDING
jgi:hypothetical protein